MDMQDSPQTDDRWLRITLDYGTSNVSAAFIVLTPTSSPATHISLEEATFPSGKHIEPQVISLTYDSNDELDISWGKAATEAFLEGKVEAEDLLDLWKLALYKVRDPNWVLLEYSLVTYTLTFCRSTPTLRQSGGFSASSKSTV